ncbi:MAG: hypothetical protein HC836_42200 [Richelia sp. RM2_1_2]|nr:hypothetical protein [Richelia sp. RM2_1_2]NJS16706.1 hypothetical protein [Nostocaceae cyanobacterium CSU_2_110]
MANKFINIVRNRLYKKGYQGFTKQEFIDCAIAIGLEDMDNPKAEELSKAVEFLIDKQLNQLSKVEEEENTVNVTLPEREETALTKSEKQDLVQQQSVEMGITLSEQDVIAIASKTDDQIADGVTFLKEARGLITQYLANQVNAYRQQSTQLLGDISGAVNDASSQISKIDEGINQGLSQILGGVAATASERKSANRATLSRLRAALNPGN